MDAGRSLVILAREVGGTLHALPTLHALAASGRSLAVMCDAAAIPVVKLCPAVTQPLPRFGELGLDRALVRSAGAEEAIVLTTRLDDLWLARTAGPRRSWGYRSLAGRLLLRHTVARPRLAGRPASDDHRELLATLGAEPPPPGPHLRLGDELRQSAWERLDRARIDRDAIVVGVYAGTSGGASGNPWPRRRFEELLRRLRRRHPEYRFVVLATTEDLWRAVRIYEETGKVHPVIGPDLRLDGLAALLAELDLVIAADSWPLQLAAAVDVPTLGLFGRDPRRWAPRGERHRTLVADRPSSLGRIGLDDVEAALEEMLP